MLSPRLCEILLSGKGCGRGGISSTEYPKPTADCYRNVHQSCAYFEERIFEGKILWKSNNVVLEIFHNADFDLQQNGMINLKIDKVISFSEKEYYNLIKLSGF